MGSRLAQTLSPKKIALPEMVFKLNDNWIDSFENAYLSQSSSDSERELSRRILNGLLEDMAQGKRVSSNHAVESLFPFSLKRNLDIATKEGETVFKTVLLVNEMCASMCDIFAAMLQDNKLAKVFGQQTMGAGGNVTMHGQAPNSGFLLQQTESLIIRSNGDCLENNGVIPDREFKTFEDIGSEFRKTITAGVGYLLEEAN